MPSSALPAVALARTVCAGAVAALLLACAAPSAAPVAEWLDAEPVRTGMPSPLAYPPVTPYDAALPDTSALAAFLRTQDVLRDAGAVSLLQPLVASPIGDESGTQSGTQSGAQSGAESGTESGAAGPSTGAALAPAAPANGAGPVPSLRDLGTGELPDDAARCARSLRVVTAADVGSAAVWWTRVAGGVQLVAAWRTPPADTPPAATSSSGPSPTPDDARASWQGPVALDARVDSAGGAGCARPAPDVAWDARAGLLHVAYGRSHSAAPGVYLVRTWMRPRDATATADAMAAVRVGAPVLVHDQPAMGAVRVASDGAVVAVVYEVSGAAGREPGRVALALSRTFGERFSGAPLGLAASDAPDARDPYVAVRGRRIAVGWSERAAGGDRFTFLTRRLRVFP